MRIFPQGAELLGQYPEMVSQFYLGDVSSVKSKGKVLIIDKCI